MNFITILFFVFLASCTPSHYDVSFDSLPQGAKVYVEGDYVGLTPVTSKVSTSRIKYSSTQVIFKKEGYLIGEFRIIGVYDYWLDRWEFEKSKYFKVLEEKHIDTTNRKTEIE